MTECPEYDHPATAVTHDIRGGLRGDDGEAPHGLFIQTLRVAHGARAPACGADLARLFYLDARGTTGHRRPADHTFHRTIVTQVPSSGVDSRAN
jgi:hypothetical protein